MGRKPWTETKDHEQRGKQLWGSCPRDMGLVHQLTQLRLSSLYLWWSASHRDPKPPYPRRVPLGQAPHGSLRRHLEPQDGNDALRNAQVTLIISVRMVWICLVRAEACEVDTVAVT